MSKQRISPRTWSRLAVAAGAALFSMSASAIVLNLSQLPMDVQEGVEPNIIFTFDDSGSMRRAFLPENVDNLYDGDDPQYRSSTVNLVYYDPDVAAAGGYVPAVDSAGNSLGDMSFTSACLDGLLKIECNQDLNNYVPTLRCDTGSTSCTPTGNPGRPYYYRYEPATTGCSPADVTNANCFVGYNLTTAQERQQFANWFSYYRIRHLAAKTAASRAFAQLSPAVRVAWQRLNGGWPGLLRAFSGADRDDFFNWLYNVPTSDWTPLHRAFNRAGRTYQQSGPNSPYAKVPGGSQPGDDTEYSCRQNFHIAFTDGEWNQHHWTAPENTNGIGEVDNTSFGLPANSYGITSYNPRPPYQGPETFYLADVAMYYWATDLRPDLENNVPTFIQDKTGTSADVFWNPQNDPANWQHMVNFTVTLGLSGNRTFDPNDPWGGGDFPALAAGTLAWGPDQVDDVWHAAVNSRGAYFTASNPQQLVNSFTKILNAISERKGSATAPATSFPLFTAGTLLYMPRFDTGAWTGDLVAVDIADIITLLDPTGSGTITLPELDTIAQWHARDVLETQTSRTILTWDPDLKKGIPFNWSAMASGGTLQSLLDQDDYGVSGRGQDRVAYFRGDRSLEGNSDGKTQFRMRQYLLGDIVNSTPRLVGPPNRLYPDFLESKPYSLFKDAYCTRQRRIYVGANDGMLHAFDAGDFDCLTQSGTAGTGAEVMAYVPSAVYRNLYRLTSLKYTHRFYVDAPPVVEDVFINGDWRTVLVGGLNAGGQGVYALDITTGSFSEGAAATHVLWEFTDLDDADLGYTFAQPRIAKTNLTTGNWAVLLGNGYNSTEDDSALGGQVSTTGNAVLYVLDMATGGLLAKIDTGVGMSDPACNGLNNGLSTVAAVDENRDFRVDYAYAGDLCGNLWRFDLTSSNPAQWKATRIFVASYTESGTTYYQPITAPPRVIYHPSEGGFIVLVGTGRNLEVADLADTSLNTVYGVWDDPNRNRSTFDRSRLFQRKFLDFATIGTNEARTSTKDPFDWYTGTGLPGPASGAYLGWYLDLQTPDGGGGYLREGEKMVKTMLVRGQNLVFVSDVPSPDPCDAGGSSWVNEVVAATGARLNETPFDYDDDGARENKSANDGGDWIESVAEGSAIAGTSIRRQNSGTISSPAVLTPTSCANPPCDEKKIFSRSDGGLDIKDENPDKSTLGRRSWRQIFAQ